MLIDSETISAAVLIEVAAEAGIVFDAAYVREHFLGRSFPTVARTIREGWGRDLPEGFEALYRARLLARFETELRPVPGALDLLGRLGVPACIATSSSPARAARSLAVAGIDRFGLPVFTASEVARGKPEPDLFLHAAARMGVAPARCLVVEDSLPGLRAARAAGMAAALFAGGSHMAGPLPPAFGEVIDADPPVAAFRSWDALLLAHPGLVRPVSPKA